MNRRQFFKRTATMVVGIVVAPVVMKVNKETQAERDVRLQASDNFHDRIAGYLPPLEKQDWKNYAAEYGPVDSKLLNKIRKASMTMFGDDIEKTAWRTPMRG